MSDVHTIIKYDGPNLDHKQMDVADLAPSLLALSDLIKSTNRKFNGDRASVKVYVNADLEQNCFELAVHVTQSILDKMTVLISDHRIIQAKDILITLGILAGTPIGGACTLYKLIKFLKNKNVESVNKVKIDNSRYEVKIDTKDKDGNQASIRVSEPVYELYSSYSTRKKAVEVLAPLKNDGYNEIQFYNGKNIHINFKKQDVPTIEDCPEVVPSNINKSDIRTVVRIRKPAYEGKSKWTVVYEKAIEASIEDEEWLTRFQSNKEYAPPNSSLEVEMIKEVVINEHGEAIDEPIYRIIKVHKVILPPEQQRLL